MNRRHRFFRNAALCAAFFLLSCLSFFLLNRYDNKYTNAGPQPISGVLCVSEPDLEKSSVLYLVEQWEYYPDKLLTPADFSASTTGYRRYLSIGQFSGMELDDLSRSSHGVGSFRLTLQLPQQPATYALELPAVYSACRLYIDDVCVLKLGKPAVSEYESQIKNSFISFTAGGQVQLLLAIGDQDGFYSGMVYPPAFGLESSVLQVRQTRLLFQGCLAFIAFASIIGACIFMFSVGSSRLAVPACGVFCWGGSLFLSLLQMFFAAPVQPQATLDAIFRSGVLVCVLLCAQRLFDSSLLMQKCSLAVGVLCALLQALGGIFITSLSARQLMLLGAVTGFQKYFTCAMLLFLCAARLWNDLPGRMPLTAATVFYATSLAADRFYPRYEPILGGWPAEVGSLFLLCAVFGPMWVEFSDALKFKRAFVQQFEQTKRQLQQQQTHYRRLRGQIDAARRAEHDLRHHLRALRGFADQENLAAIRDYLENYTLSVIPKLSSSYSNYFMVDSLLAYYAAEAQAANIRVDLSIGLTKKPFLSDDELSILLGNLLENAIEACCRISNGERWIRLRGEESESRFVLLIENAALPASRLSLKSSKRKGKGIGIRSVKEIVASHEGVCDFILQDNTFAASILIPISVKRDGFATSERTG